MKRYRVLQFDFDSRTHSLTMEIKEEWDEKTKKQYYQNRKQTEKGLIIQYGASNAHLKKQNFIDLKPKPISILAFHNKFFEQIRSSFVVGAYYPALTGACALGERILNHLIIKLRDDYKSTPEYKKVYRKDSFDNWTLAIETLEKWNVLLPEVVKKFKELEEMRHKSIHFRPDVDRNNRELALNAIHCLQEIIKNQFSGFGPQPRFITSIPGESYIKKECEDQPFIKKIYLPNCLLVGPKHVIKQMSPTVEFDDNFEYPNQEISDEKFVKLRRRKKQ